MRQAYRVVRTPASLIITSDGLSDPFVGQAVDAPISPVTGAGRSSLG
jgi:hypothetical protein